MIISIKKEQKGAKKILKTGKESDLHRGIIGDSIDKYPGSPLHGGIRQGTDNAGGTAGTFDADGKCRDL